MKQLQRLRISAALISLLGGACILSLKYYAYRLTGSAALKSDAIESIVNVVAGFFALGAVLFGEQPADSEHPYGHGKIEHFSAAFEGGLISLAAAMIFYEAFQAWVHPSPIEHLSVGLLWNLGAGALNGVLGWFLIGVGRKTRSHAIEADGHHVLSDFWTTLGLGASLSLALLTGWTWLDPMIALMIGGLLCWTGFKLVGRSAQALLDREDPKLVESLVKAMQKVRTDSIISVHGLRTLRSGNYVHVDVHVVMPENFTVGEAHDIVRKFGEDVLRECGETGEFHAHIDPGQILEKREITLADATSPKDQNK